MRNGFICIFMLIHLKRISCIVTSGSQATSSPQVTSNKISKFAVRNIDEDFITDFKIELNEKNPRHVISSPGFPYEDYLPNTHLTYEVEIKLDEEVKQLSNRILLTFEMFSVEESELCTKDGLEIADISNQVRVFCGLQVGRTILSEGSKLYIRFFTDSAVESKGYRIHLEMYNSGCSQHFTDVKSGSFSSPNYPGRYFADDLCIWKIDAPENSKIYVKLDDTFDIRAYEPLCVQDYLSVSLTGDFETHEKRYCHGKRPVSMYSTKNSMLFMFRTDCCFQGSGFSATFTVVKEDEVIPTSTPEPPVLPLCSCGIENIQENERIYGGKEVNPRNRYPWVVALVKKAKNKKDTFFCGGTLINKQYVLTAAHCLDREKVSTTRIAIGAHDSASSDVVTVEVTEFIVHPEFVRYVYFNDIALIKLKDPVDFHNTIRPICLPSDSSSNLEGETAVVVGWGQQNSSTQDTNLQQVDVRVVSHGKCVRQYKGVYLDTNICAGGEFNEDACGGDSGGPLAMKFDGRWNLIGIVSWGSGCGKEGYPGIYTRISKYLQWIKKHTEDSPPCDDEVAPPVQPNLANCGIPNRAESGRIVGGTEATPFEFPWMAMIVYEGRVIGAGALINPYYVITAASIIDNEMLWYPDLLSVFLGRHNLTKGQDTVSKRYSVKTVYPHPQYGKPSPYNNDVALLRLNTVDGVSQTYNPICLPRSDAWYPPDLKLTTAGWGSTSNGGDGSNVLRKVDLRVWAEEQCEQRYPGWFTNTMMCAYKEGADTCHGDEGAPLMRLYSDRYYLAGLSSWATKDGCAQKNAPRVFSAVHANLQWISKVTGLEIM